ncbi:hypothetical protein N836_11200 [Leptolyngbya sp. Heron Island J]|nr:hypothetical protein N836_11200 [Leptolyngbya sp. Heron Island J]
MRRICRLGVLLTAHLSIVVERQQKKFLLNHNMKTNLLLLKKSDTIKHLFFSSFELFLVAALKR